MMKFLLISVFVFILTCTKQMKNPASSASLNESRTSITIKENEDIKHEDLKSEKNSEQQVKNASTVDVNTSVDKVSKVTSAVSATKEILSFEEVNHYPYSLTSKNYLWINDQEKMDEIFSIIHKQSGGLRLAPIPTVMDNSSYLIFKPTLKTSNDIEITEIYLQNNILNINVKPLENPDLRAGSRISPNVLVKILKKITDKKITINYI